jgi:hypothetical protein
MDSCLDQNNNPTSERQNSGSLFSSRCEPSQTGNFNLFPVLCQCLGRIQRKNMVYWTYAGGDYNLTLCPLQSRLHLPWATLCPESTFARVDFIPQSRTLDLASGYFGHSNSFPKNLCHLLDLNPYSLYPKNAPNGESDRIRIQKFG